MGLAVLTTVGLTSVTPASGAGASGAAAAVGPLASTCRWNATPGQFWVTDPTNSPVALLGGVYGDPGTKGVAYRVNGQFTHSTTMSFTAYDNLDDITAANYVINDRDIIPDPGSVNPFVPGTKVMARNRNYTVYFWPDSVAVPAGLKNVILYPTKPGASGTGAARFSVAYRQYHPQPGYPTITGIRDAHITAVSAANPNKRVVCPLTPVGAFTKIQLGSTYAHLKYWGSVQAPPEPKTGNKIYFVSAPASIFLGLDGYPGTLPNSCLQYMVATLPRAKISVTTMHAVPEYFNNNLVTRTSVMKDYPIRYQSFGVNYFTLNTRLYNSGWVNTDDAVYTSKGEWTTVYLPGDPQLPAAQIRQVRSMARANHFNVIQMPPPPTGPIQRLLPYPSIAVRQKAISSSFRYSNLALPCWSKNHSYKTWGQQSSPAFFAKYASNRRNNGKYYTDGVGLTFAQFLRQFS